MVQLTFYGGVGEIGGNKILLEDRETKLFLDFGMSFNRRGRFFEEFLTPRTANGIGDFLEMGLIPDIPGVYREDLLEHQGRKAQDPEVAGVFLSHAHADHANYISFLHKDIPIFCGETCKGILDAVAEQSQRTIENEVLDFRPRPLFRCDYRKPPVPRMFHTFRTGDKVKVDSLEVEPVHVDHCLSEDTLVQLSNGEIIKVGEVYDTCYINAVDFKQGRNNQAFAVRSKHKTYMLYQIKTRFGEIKTSAEHRFFIVDGLDIIERKAKDLKKGDFLINWFETGFKGKKQKIPNVEHRELVKVSQEGLNLIKKRRIDRQWSQSQLALKAGLSKFYGDFERGLCNIDSKRLIEVLEALNLDNINFYERYITKVREFSIPSKTSPEFFQLLGYVLGDGSWNPNDKKTSYLEIGDKDIQNLRLYQTIAKSIFNEGGKITLSKRNKLRLSSYIGKLIYKISPSIISKSPTRQIPSIVHKATLKEIAAFLRGLYDAEGSFGNHSIILTSTSSNIIDITRLLLKRFGILSWKTDFIEPISKRQAYQLAISHHNSIRLFYRKIGFGSEEKQKKLQNFIKVNKKSQIERIELLPFNGEYLRKKLKAMKITTWDFQKNGIHIAHYLNGYHYPSRNMVIRILNFLKKCKKGNLKEKNRVINQIEQILSLNAVLDPIKSIEHLNANVFVYDFEVPGYSNFLANGFIVHNSVPGSYGSIIHTSEGAVVFTGDLRMHGLHAQMTTDFMQAAKEAKPIAMISEGTRIDRERADESEEKIYKESKQNIKNCRKLSIVDFNFKDIDRFTTFFRIARDLDKTLVISFKHACFLEQYHTDSKLKAPDSKDNRILLLKPKRLTGTYIDEDYTDQYIKSRLHYPNIITAEEIIKHPTDFMVVLNFWYFNMLVDLQPRGGLYIHSLSEPFNEEMEISYERMKNWLRFFDLRFKQSHCSGHISGSDLKELITMVNPKELYPIHTEHPGIFRYLPIRTRMVREGKTYKL